MRRLYFLIFLALGASLSAQVLEVPTLNSKGIVGKLKTIEWQTYRAVQDKGLIVSKKDVETYDESGRLSSVLTQDFQNGRNYKSVYNLNKKGLLSSIDIINSANNLILRSTNYEYKKGLLTKTTQTQDVNTLTKNYSYNKKEQLIQVEVYQNGSLSLSEFYELDDEDRRTKISRKLANETEVKVISTFTYRSKDGKLISVENRNTEQGKFNITKTMLASSRRDVNEVTKRVSDGQKSTNRQFFEDDENGNWVKGEVIGEQYSRSRLVLRKLTYANGKETGRLKMNFPEDYHAQFIRQYNQKQVAINGKVHNAGLAYQLEYTDDRLVYVSDLKTWVILKNYDKVSSMKTWGEAHVIGGGKEDVFWAASKSGFSVFNAGRKVLLGRARNNYSAQAIGNSYAAYVRGDINKSFLVENPTERAGQVIKADLLSDHYHWGKVSDSTYLLTNRGRSVSLQKQIEDREGNKLAMLNQGDVYYWYFLPGFREKYENSDVGEIYGAEYVDDVEKFLSAGKLKVDLSAFRYKKFANTRYRLESVDGQSVANIASRAIKTPDDKLVAYFPLTKQYLLMEKFYELEKGKEWNNQSVKVVTDSTAYVYYLYNENKKVNFYTPKGRIEKRAFASHKLESNTEKYGAIVYDSTNNISYGMNYDLGGASGFGPMKKLPVNSRGAYIIKLNGNRWSIIEKGIKVTDYTFSKLSENGSVVHFFKDFKGITKALEFKGFKELEVGDMLGGRVILKYELDEYIKEFGIDRGLKKSEIEKAPKRKVLTFDKETDRLFARDANGDYVHNSFSWYFSKGTGKDLIAYDSVAKYVYRLKDYYASEKVTEGKMEAISTPIETKVLKWYTSNINLSINGDFQTDINRAFITQDPEDEIWKEVVYDQSDNNSYQVSYPADSNFYVLDPKPLPPSYNQAYLFRINEKKFVTIEKGVVSKDQKIRSRILGEDIIRMVRIDNKVKGYLFKGYKSAKMLELIPAEEMTDESFATAWAKAGESLKTNVGTKEVTIPNDKWMTAINKCTTNQKCAANLIDQMGTALKNKGFEKKQIERAIIPYLVGIGSQNKDRLFDVFMVLKSDYVGALTNPLFPKELSKYIREKSSAVVGDYVKKNGAPKIKTVEYKGKGGGN